MGVQFNSSQYGPPVPVIYGTAKVGGSCLWYGDFKSQASSQKVGKGGGGSTTTGYTYSASFMLGLCEGPITGIGNVFSGTSTVNLSSVGAVIGNGAQGQAAWSHLSGGFALGYSQTAWLAVANLNLGSSASLPDWNPEVIGLHIYGGTQDANPSDILTDICTDPTHGINFPWLGSLTQYSNYCIANNLLLSPCYDQEQTAQQTLEDLFKYTNTAAWFSEGVLKVQPYGDVTVSHGGVTYSPNLTPLFNLGAADFIVQTPGDAPITVTRKSPADCMNMVRVEYQDRSNWYHSSVVIASIDQDVVQHGGRADTTESVDMCKVASVARFIAQNLVQSAYYIRNTYEFKLSWRYCMLEPMDIVTLTDANCGLNIAPVRIIEVSEDENGVFSITAEEFPEGVGHSALYNTQPNNGGTIDPNSDPGAVNPPYLFRMPGFLVSNNTPEIGCAVNGANPLWGGAEVWLSHDGTSYTFMGVIAQPARYGALATSLAQATADPDVTNTPQVTLYTSAQLLGGSQADADNLNTLSMVDTEVHSYETATLVSGETYQLGYLRRGAYGTANVAHSAGAPWVRLDDAIFRIGVDPSQIGTTVYIKFRSLNIFGRSPRTLASETAYTYVIGSNVELPDTPPVPASFGTQGVADGVAITWNNTNPDAVGCTSIERSSASTGPWTVIAQCGPTQTGYTDHFTTGATYYYRARARGPLVSSGWSGYTAVWNSAGTNVNAISTTATSALNQANQLNMVNLSMAQGMFGWTNSNSSDVGNWYGETGTNGPNGGTSTYCVKKVSTYISQLNNTFMPCSPGQVIKASGQVKGLGTPNAIAGIYIAFYDINRAFISAPNSNYVTGNVQQTLYLTAVAPGNAAFVTIGPTVGSNASPTGYYSWANFTWNGQPATIDEVPDGATFVKSMQQIGSGSAWLIDNALFQLTTPGAFSVPGWSARSGCQIYSQTASPAPSYGSAYLVLQTTSGAANVADSAKAFPVVPGDNLSIVGLVNALSGAATTLQVNFYNTSGGFVSQIVTNSVTAAAWTQVSGSGVVPATAAIARVGLASAGGGAYYSLFNFVQVTVNDVRVSGSGARIGDQRNLPSVNFGNYGSGWSGLSCSYTSTSTSATVSISAATLQAGSVSISYNASSTTITGSAGVTFTYYLYYQDPNHSGGTQTLRVSTSLLGTINNDGNIYICSVTVTFPTSGSGSGGGGGIPCPLRKAWVIKRGKGGKRQYIRAGQVRRGDFLLLCNGSWGEVTFSEPRRAECVRLVSKLGTLGCSTSAPMKTRQGTVVAPECAGKDVLALTTEPRHAHVDKVLPLGEDWVQHITCQNDFFWTGDSKACLLAHHNLKPT